MQKIQFEIRYFFALKVPTKELNLQISKKGAYGDR